MMVFRAKSTALTAGAPLTELRDSPETLFRVNGCRGEQAKAS